MGANGLLQTVNYVADPVNGFRVAGTNLPVGPAVPAAAPLEAPVFDLPVPVAVEDTPEAAAVAHAPLVKSVVETPATVETEVAATPVVSYAAAPSRDAVLTQIKLNPGHATFYRVD